MRTLVRVFLSLKTAFGLFCLFIVFSFIGSIMLPSHLSFFSGIDDTPLFRWLYSNGVIKLIWWIYAMILTLFFLAISTIFCTVETLLNRVSMRNLIIKLSPQIMHIGVLLIMLGHLLTASIGFKADILVKKAEIKEIMPGIGVYLENVSQITDESGYTVDWDVVLWWVENGKKTRKDVLKPLRPLYYGSLGVFSKSVSLEPEPSALIRVIRDPGAVWALTGGILLCLGGVGFIYGTLTRELT
jgi:hypothetical protein